MTDEALPNSPVKVAQEAANFQWGEGKAQPGIGVALSGGGFRAMLFHAGALARMNELGLLSQSETHCERLGRIHHVGLSRGEMARSGQRRREWQVREFPGDCGRTDPGFLPSKDRRHRRADRAAAVGISASGEVAKSYNSYLFDDKTLQDMPDSPFFVFCATNLQTGVLWRFTKSYAGDYVIGYLDKPAIAGRRRSRRIVGISSGAFATASSSPPPEASRIGRTDRM